MATAQSHHSQKSNSSSDDDDYDDYDDDARDKPFALRFAQSLFGEGNDDVPRQQWKLFVVPSAAYLHNDDCSPPATKKQKSEATTITSSSLLWLFCPNDDENETDAQNKIWFQIASFLEPHEIQALSHTCRATRSALGLHVHNNHRRNLKQIALFRLQSICSHFGILQSYANQLFAVMQYQVIEIVHFFTRLSAFLQSIYGRKFILTVPAVHRALVAHCILNQLTGVFRYDQDDDEEDDDDDEDNDRRRSQFPAQTPSRIPVLTTSLFYTRFQRFAWSVLLGDSHYSFAQSECREYGHGENIIRNWNLRSNVLRQQGHVWMYMYQDEDDFQLVGLEKRPGRDKGIYIKSTENNTAHFKSLAHYYVLGKRENPFDNNNNQGGRKSHNDDDDDDDDIIDDDMDDEYDEFGDAVRPPPYMDPAIIVERLHWLLQRQLLNPPIAQDDWKRVVRSVIRSQSSAKDNRGFDSFLEWDRDTVANVHDIAFPDNAFDLAPKAPQQP